MHMKPIVIFFAAFVATGIIARIAPCQMRYYSYVDEDGIRHFTNIPPVTRVWELKVTGSEPAAAIPVSSKPKTEKFNPIIEKYARDYQLDPSLIHSIIETESDFNPKAVSPKGAQGLMQLMPATAKRFGVRNVYDPEENLEGGIQYLNFLLDTFNGDVNLTLAAYNAGENIVQKLKAIPPYRETRDYVRRISDILGGSGSVPLYDLATKRVTYVALVDGKLKFTNVDPPASSVVFDGYHMPRAGGSL